VGAVREVRREARCANRLRWEQRETGIDEVDINLQNRKRTVKGNLGFDEEITISCIRAFRRRK
jgi:hypothetical protein